MHRTLRRTFRPIVLGAVLLSSPLLGGEPESKPSVNAPTLPTTSPAMAWTSLFDGKTLAGWRPIGKGDWKVEDGVIVGRHAKADDFGHLVTDKRYRDFTIRLKFKSIQGNSGLYFRIGVDPRAFSGVSGFQAEIDPRNDIGGLYETNGRGWVVKPTPEEIARYFKPDEWMK